ncbi:hypothetical protein MmTuc01_2592 [Methanosarcina mazei Tuc01]|uniref:Uncharacterized protein n=1 Tax=Methanosarcina mazei Tuc01 TaxID=1236903 RepID=M1QLM0_METMZ|nr:hypothetical protein MmTuc01_2592 [Methanosarcina mazei Tuc01]
MLTHPGKTLNKKRANRSWAYLSLSIPERYTGISIKGVSYYR